MRCDRCFGEDFPHTSAHIEKENEVERSGIVAEVFDCALLVSIEDDEVLA
jgi:hypothetical protein